MTDKKMSGQISARAVINRIKIDSLPSFVFDSSGNDIVPFGQDNLYPQRIFDAISKSPTGRGCVKRFHEFVFGLGIKEIGDIIVNRDEETLNDVLNECVRNYVNYSGFAIHFNFNIFGQIIEMTAIDLRFPRKTKDLEQSVINNWEFNTSFLSGNNDIILDLYNPKKFFELVRKSPGGFKKYKGQLLYWTADHQIYPTAQIDSASVSASYELEAQIYPYANIKNGFSGNKIIKFPGMMTGTETQEEIGSAAAIQGVDQIPFHDRNLGDEHFSSGISKIEKQLEQMHGSNNAGSTLVIEVPVGVSGEFKDFKMIEDLTPTNVDNLFTNQNSKAENDILKVFTMPKILLGISDAGMFNEASFNDAFNYKNADTEGDRRIIERAFSSFLPRTVFGVDSIEIEPLRMKGEGEIEIEADGEAVSGVSPEQLAAQASLKGSVGGVNGILAIQQGFTEGKTSFGSALSILKLIYGFTQSEALSLLGDPEKTE